MKSNDFGETQGLCFMSAIAVARDVNFCKAALQHCPFRSTFRQIKWSHSYCSLIAFLMPQGKQGCWLFGLLPLWAPLFFCRGFLWQLQYYCFEFGQIPQWRYHFARNIWGWFVCLNGNIVSTEDITLQGCTVHLNNWLKQMTAKSYTEKLCMIWPSLKQNLPFFEAFSFFPLWSTITNSSRLEEQGK